MISGLLLLYLGSLIGVPTWYNIVCIIFIALNLISIGSKIGGNK